MGLAYGVQPQFIGVAQPAMSSAPNQPPQMGDAVVIDGTPVRVVILCLAAAAGLTALRLGGFRFNVGVSS